MQPAGWSAHLSLPDGMFPVIASWDDRKPLLGTPPGMRGHSVVFGGTRRYLECDCQVERRMGYARHWLRLDTHSVNNLERRRIRWQTKDIMNP